MPSYVQCMTVRPSVCLSVMFVYSDRTNKRIIKKKFRHRIATRTVQVLPHQTLWQYSDGDPPPPNGGVECRWGWQKSRFSANICLHRVLSTVRTPSVIYTAAPDRGKLVTRANIVGRHCRPTLLADNVGCHFCQPTLSADNIGSCLAGADKVLPLT